MGIQQQHDAPSNLGDGWGSSLQPAAVLSAQGMWADAAASAMLLALLLARSQQPAKAARRVNTQSGQREETGKGRDALTPAHLSQSHAGGRWVVGGRW